MLLSESIKTKCESVSSFMSDLEKARGTGIHAKITTGVGTTKSQGRKNSWTFVALRNPLSIPYLSWVLKFNIFKWCCLLRVLDEMTDVWDLEKSSWCMPELGFSLVTHCLWLNHRTNKLIYVLKNKIKRTKWNYHCQQQKPLCWLRSHTQLSPTTCSAISLGGEMQWEGLGLCPIVYHEGLSNNYTVSRTTWHCRKYATVYLGPFVGVVPAIFLAW